ncbi:MAG: hypothetical protein A2Y15_05620 [Clostridiales bacterium GWF2_36_10]|nr:MAG: hypothetical protein A2Y15_05620 [Clostridiales bacterium GWF2_36_10]HAN21978.1 hypothetical protein [Clostridiales bacterium]
MGIETIYELLIVSLSSAGILGTVIASLLSIVLKQTKALAEKRRKERILLELQRLEGEEKLSQLILLLIKFSKGLCEMDELDNAEKCYVLYLDKNREQKNEILTEYIIK